LFNREIDSIKKKMLVLHEDLQYDYEQELERLKNQSKNIENRSS